MKYIETNRGSVTCIVGILIAAVFTCAFFWISSLVASGQLKRNETPDVEKTASPSFDVNVSPTVVDTICPTWRTLRDDISGSRSDVWELIYEDKPDIQISWREFKDQVVVCNPELEKDGYVFIEGKTYILP